jgi:serine/threonine-protein kinase RsbW
MQQTKVIHSDLKAARHVAEQLLREVHTRGYSDDVCFAIRLALEEALVNAIKHGNGNDPHKTIRISADVGEEEAAITIADEGRGFDPTAVPDPRTDENLEKPSGRGIMLMRAYMDKVSYNPQGNEVRIVKRRA